MTSPTGGRATNTTAASGEPASPTATIREGQAGCLPLGAAAQNKGTLGRYSLSFDGPNIRARRFLFQTSLRQFVPRWGQAKGQHFRSAVLSRFPTTQNAKGGFAVRLTAQELEQMKSVDIGAVSADALADVSVKIEFAEGGPSLQETLTAFLIRQKSGL